MNEKGTLCSQRDCRHMRLPNFQNFTYYQFNYRQVKFILGICISNVNLNHSIGQNWLHKSLTIEKCQCRLSGYSDREVRAVRYLKTVEKGHRVHKMV